MSAIIVVVVEGVLCQADEDVPTAAPALSAIKMIGRLSDSWQVGFVCAAPREVAVAWLKEVGAPTWCWVAQATEDDRADVILRQLAQRQDRAQFVIAGNARDFDKLAERG